MATDLGAAIMRRVVAVMPRRSRDTDRGATARGREGRAVATLVFGDVLAFSLEFSNSGGERAFHLTRRVALCPRGPGDPDLRE